MVGRGNVTQSLTKLFELISINCVYIDFVEADRDSYNSQTDQISSSFTADRPVIVSVSGGDETETGETVRPP